VAPEGGERGTGGFGQTLERDDSAGLDQQDRQEGLLELVAELDPFSVLEYLQRAEDPKVEHLPNFQARC
jgi:hypothetical protein